MDENPKEVINYNYSKFSNLVWNNKIFISIMLVIVIGVLNGSLIVFLVALTSLLIAVNRGSFKEIGLSRPANWKKTILWGVLLGVIIEMLSLVVLEPLLEVLTGQTFDYSAFESMRGNLAQLVVWLIVGWVVGGFLEEISLRGFMITQIKKVLGKSSSAVVIALLITSIHFGLAHAYQGTSGIIATGLTGLVLGIIYVKNGYNVWLPIIVHGVIDTIGLTLMYFSYDITLGSWVKSLIN